MLATRIAAHAVSYCATDTAETIFTPSASVDPPKYSPTTSPIIASTDAIFKAEKTNGRLLGIRTRRNTTRWGTAYERINSSDSGRTDVSPRSVFTRTGKKQSTAAITI